MSKTFASRAWAAREEDDPEPTHQQQQPDSPVLVRDPSSGAMFASGSGNAASGTSSPIGGAGLSPVQATTSSSSTTLRQHSSQLRIELADQLEGGSTASSSDPDAANVIVKPAAAVAAAAVVTATTSKKDKKQLTAKTASSGESSSGDQSPNNVVSGSSNLQSRSGSVHPPPSGKRHQPTSSLLRGMSSLPCSPVMPHANNNGSANFFGDAAVSTNNATTNSAAAASSNNNNEKGHHHRESSIALIDGVPHSSQPPLSQQPASSKLRSIALRHHRSVSSAGSAEGFGVSGEMMNPVVAAGSVAAAGHHQPQSSSPEHHLRQASLQQQQQQPPTEPVKRPWRKILYDHQEGYEDNYVDPSFMQQLNMNAELRKLKVGDMIRDTLVIVQQVSIAVIFCFVFISCQTRSVGLWQVGALDLALFAFGVFVTVVTQGRLGHLSLAAFRSIALATVVLSSTVLVAAPVFHTLTKNYADDTIYALSIVLAFVHLVGADYDFMNGNISAFSGSAENADKSNNNGASGNKNITDNHVKNANSNNSEALSNQKQGSTNGQRPESPGATVIAAQADLLVGSSSSPPGAPATSSPVPPESNNNNNKDQLLHSKRNKFSMEHNLSQNCAVVWTVLLASRLDDARFTAVLLLFGVECFSLSPFVRRALREASVEVHSGFSLALFGVALGCLVVTRAVLALVFIVAVLCVALLLPISFVRVQDGRFKSQIRGPWDEAVPRNSEAAKQWANTT